MKSCASPVPFEVLVSYWAGDLDATRAGEVEAHVFACARCTAESERVAAITEPMRGLEPAVIGAARLGELRAAGRKIEDNFVAPGERRRVVFSEQELVIHHLGGLDLEGVDRVGLVARAADTGEILTEHPAAPFDATAGEVLIACQRHFAVFPPNIAFELTTFARGEPKKVTHYVVEHEWALV